MKKFVAIEGLRGWLAWVVVFSHLVPMVISRAVGNLFAESGHYAVLLFIIISGFVITHLIVEKPEPYPRYLLRRFMRIFPLFAVTCCVGFFTMDILAHALTQLPWSTDPAIAERVQVNQEIAASDHQYFWPHVIAHLLMLHGAISNNLLPLSQYAFNSPAWSISLEWQFYVLAPLVVLLARQRKNLLWIALGVAFIEAAASYGVFGSFRNPSFLPGAAGYFAVGIASRLGYPILAGTIRRPLVILALVVLLLPLGWGSVPLLLWALVLTGMILNSLAQESTSFQRWYRLALESPVALYFGSRSYSVYLCHLPVLSLCLSFWSSRFPLAGRYATLAGLVALVVPLVVVVAEVLYRAIERPGMALGSRWARRLSQGRRVAVA